MNYREFFKAAGFKPEDEIGKGIKDQDGVWRGTYLTTVEEYCKLLEREGDKQNYYYSHAAHSGVWVEGEKNFQEDNYVEIVCMVIDIDYGPHHKKAGCLTLKDAQRVATALPVPTVTIHSGGGLQLVYRLRSRIEGHEGKMKYKMLYQVMAARVGGDACQSIGHVFRVPMTYNYKKGVPRRSVEILSQDVRIEYSLQDLEKWCKDHHIAMPSKENQKAKSIAVKKAKKVKLVRTDSGVDNSREAFKTIEKILRKFPDVSERMLMAGLKKLSFFAHYERFGKDAEKYCRIDIRRIRRKLTSDARPQPFVKVVKLKYAGEPNAEAVVRKRDDFNRIYDTSGKERITIALSLMERLLLEKKQAILNFPCASGKTTAAMILTSAYASSENRFWIVTEKIEDVKRIAGTLREIGTNVQEWHGRPDGCPVTRLEFIQQKRGYFCRQCKSPCTAVAKNTASDVWDAPGADVLVTTHSHWAAAIAQEKIPSTVKYIIVDESPSLMEYFTLTAEKIAVFSRIFDQLRGKFDNDINFIRDSLKSGNCRRIPSLNSLEYLADVQKCLYKLLSEGIIAVEDFEQMYAFLSFFSAEEIYGMLTQDGGVGKMVFIRGTVDLKTSIPHLILDGSALMSDVKWEGFRIYSCPQLKQEYPNTTVEVINGNPSKNFLADPLNFSLLAEKIIQAAKPDQNLLLFSNKTLTHDLDLKKNIEELRKRLLEQKVKLIEMSRGEHIGSNKGRLAQVNAVCMSLFNNIAYYVLRTALVNHQQIRNNEIWRIPFSTPSMKANGGFTSPKIQQTYCRAIVVDLYQTILRGCIRDNAVEQYNAICVVSGLDIISVLQEELPGATFHFENEEVVDALLKGESESSIVKLMEGDERRCYERLRIIRRSLGF